MGKFLRILAIGAVIGVGYYLYSSYTSEPPVIINNNCSRNNDCNKVREKINKPIVIPRTKYVYIENTRFCAKPQTDDYIKLVFHGKDDNQIRYLPLEIIANNCQWCLSTMLNDIIGNEIIEGTIEEIDMKDVMSLQEFDMVTSTFDFKNKWELHLNTIILLCKQGLIQSVACNKLLTSTNAFELTFACRVLELELNVNKTQIECTNAEDYVTMYQYFRYSINVLPYQYISYKYNRKTINLLFVNGLPFVNMKMGEKNSYECLSRKTHIKGCSENNPIIIKLQHLLPGSFNISKSVDNSGSCRIVSKKDKYYPNKLRENKRIWNTISHLRVDKRSDRYFSCEGRRGKCGLEGPSDKSDGYERLPIARPIKFISPSDISNQIPIGNVKITTNDYLLSSKFRSSGVTIKVHCGYVKI